MAILLLPLSFATLYLAVYQRFADWRLVLLRTTLLWTTCLVAMTELLSLVEAVTPLGLSLAWGALLLGTLAWLSEQARRKKLRLPIRIALPGKADLPEKKSRPAHLAEAILPACLVFILAVTALVAWLAPPQTWDSIHYHLSRVAHWAEMGALRHFATGNDLQNNMPPGAEMIVLHTYVLAQGDRLVNFVQWSSMAACLAAGALIARQLGANRLGQLLAAVTLAATPLGIVEASCTMTDYVAALWIACAAVEMLELMRGAPPAPGVVFSSLAAGLTLLTKPTAAPYLVLLALGIAVALMRRFGWQRLVLWTCLAALLAAGLNAGHNLRNLQTYGNSISSSRVIDRHFNQLWTPQGILVNVLRNSYLEMGTPWPKVNYGLFVALRTISSWLEVDLDDSRSVSEGPFRVIHMNTNEIRISNPLQAALAGVAIPAVLFKKKRFSAAARWLAWGAAGGFVLFSAIYKWQIFGSRYHLSFFVLAAPLIALAFSAVLKPGYLRLAALAMTLAALPFLFSIHSRPIIPGSTSHTGSILLTPRQDLYFSNSRYLKKSYLDMTNLLKDTGCDKVTLIMPGSNAEYLLWMLMGAPRPGLQLNWTIIGPATIHAPVDFEPCAMICDTCTPPPDTWRGMLQVYNQDNTFVLYMR